jgi:multiple sugar transport system ATP-binding protein
VSLSRRLGVTTVYVTHDQSEAMSMADRVAILRRGRLQQVGSPAEVYTDPENVFVAAFLGTPRTSLLEGAVYADDGRTVVDLGTQVLHLPAGDPRYAGLAGWDTERVTVALRADALRLVAVDSPGVVLHGRVRLVENLGHEMLAHVDTGGIPTSNAASRIEAPEHGFPSDALPAARSRGRRLARLMSRQHHPPPAAPTARTTYGFYPVYDPELPGDPLVAGEVVIRIPAPARVAVGDELTCAVDLDRLLLFDRAGNRIRFAAL